MDPRRSPLEESLVAGLTDVAPRGDTPDAHTAAKLAQLFDVQVASRHCDLAARWLRSQGKGYQSRINAILRRAMLAALKP